MMKTRGVLVTTFLVVLLLVGCKPDPLVQAKRDQASIESALEKAQTDLLVGKTQEGLKELQTLSEQYPQNAAVLEATAMAYQANQQWILAAKNFEALSQLAPDELQFLMYAAQMYTKAGLTKPAIALYNDYLEQFPEDYGTWWTLSEVYASENNAANALKAAKNSIRYSNHPLTPAQILYIANLYEQTDDLKKSIQYYEKAEQGESVLEKKIAQIALFKIYVKEKSWDKAQKFLKAAQASKLNDPALQTALDAYTQREIQLAQAQEAELIQEQLALKKLAEQAEVERVAADLAEQQRLASFVPTASTYAEKAVDARNSADSEQAIHFYWKAIALNPNVDWYWFDLSRLYYDKGEYDQAQMAALEANRITPSLPNTLCLLKALQHDKSSDKFLSALETAKKEYPMSPEITIDLAIAYQKIQQNNRNARILAQEFLDMAGPTHPRAPEAIFILEVAQN
jgi:tetratricopeptide (TPR) repeat protein